MCGVQVKKSIRWTNRLMSGELVMRNLYIHRTWCIVLMIWCQSKNGQHIVCFDVLLYCITQFYCAWSYSYFLQKYLTVCSKVSNCKSCCIYIYVVFFAKISYCATQAVFCFEWSSFSTYPYNLGLLHPNTDFYFIENITDNCSYY